MLASASLMDNLSGDKKERIMIAPPAEAVTGARWSYKNVSSKRVWTGNDRTECLHGASSGNGPDDKLDALPVHQSVDFVCLCPADGTDSSLLTLPLAPRGGAVSKNSQDRAQAAWRHSASWSCGRTAPYSAVRALHHILYLLDSLNIIFRRKT